MTDPLIFTYPDNSFELRSSASVGASVVFTGEVPKTLRGPAFQSRSLHQTPIDSFRPMGTNIEHMVLQAKCRGHEHTHYPSRDRGASRADQTPRRRGRPPAFGAALRS